MGNLESQSKRAGVQHERKKWSLFNVHKALLSILRTGKGRKGFTFKLAGSGSKLQAQETGCMLRSNCSKSNMKQKLVRREDGLSGAPPTLLLS